MFYHLKAKINERVAKVPADKEFKVNEYLSLRLEEGKTNIYVRGRFFQQCKFLLLDIPLENSEEYSNINSIDEAADRLGWQYEGQIGVTVYKLDPDTEFWGHCSNLQAWWEHEYDTLLLHSNLAFPLLKVLVDAGDSIAQKVFKEEIALRIVSGYPKVFQYLLEQNYLNYLSINELETVLGDIIKMISNMEDTEDKINFFLGLVRLMKGTELWNTFLPQIEALAKNAIKAIRGMKYSWNKLYVSREFLKAVNGTMLWSTFLPQIETLARDAINALSNMEDTRNRVSAFIYLLEPMKNAELRSIFSLQIEPLVRDAIKLAMNMENDIDKANILRDLLEIMNGTKLLFTFSSQIEGLTIDVIKLVNDLEDHKFKVFALRDLMDAMKGTKLSSIFCPKIEALIRDVIEVMKNMENLEDSDIFRERHVLGVWRHTSTNFSP